MHNRFKPILPAPVAPRPGAEGRGQQSSPIPGGGVTLRQRRAAVRVACNVCRAKRTACDGNRPTCNQCLKRGSACVYVSATSSETPIMALKRELDVLKKNQHSLSEAIDILRTVPEDTSVTMLKRLRSVSVSDPAGVLSVVKGDDAPGQAVPRHVLARAPPQDGPEFELMLRHAWAYPALLPLDASAVSMTAFTIPSHSFQPTPDLAPDTPYASSSRPPQHATQSPQSGSSRASPSAAYPSSSSSAAPTPVPAAAPTPASGTPGSPFPFGHALPPEYMEYCDERLNFLQIDYWIGTEVSNATAATLISLYLRLDHPTLGLFDSGLFLDDLVARRTRFCSPLLVCSMLLWAQHAYRSLVSDLQPNTADMLLSEASALWKYEQSVDSLPTIAAAQLLGFNCIYSGEDAGLPYIAVGSEMAQRFGLFGPHRTRFPVSVGHANEMDEDEWVQAAAHTAWGIYSFLCMHSFMFQRYEPSLDHEPLLDVPGAMSHTVGDENLSDGEVAPSLPDYMGRTFPAICRFWMLNTEWMSAYYSPFQPPMPGRVSWSFAQRTFDKLLDWCDKLHFRLARGDQAAHHIMILHIWFHSVVVELFRPWALSGYVQSDLDEMDAASADGIFSASIHQLKHIILVFKYTFPCAQYLAHWHLALLQVANAVLEDTNDSQWRDYFALCVNGYADLVDSFPVAEGIVRGLLSMGLRDGTLSAPEAQGFLHRVRSRCIRPSYATPTSSTIVVDLKLAVTDRNAAQLKSMADMFESLTLFDQFINPDTESQTGVEGFQSVVSSPHGGGGV